MLLNQNVVFNQIPILLLPAPFSGWRSGRPCNMSSIGRKSTALQLFPIGMLFDTFSLRMLGAENTQKCFRFTLLLHPLLFRLYEMFTSRNPHFEANGGKVSIISHSLGESQPSWDGLVKSKLSKVLFQPLHLKIVLVLGSVCCLDDIRRTRQTSLTKTFKPGNLAPKCFDVFEKWKLSILLNNKLLLMLLVIFQCISIIPKSFSRLWSFRKNTYFTEM